MSQSSVNPLGRASSAGRVRAATGSAAAAAAWSGGRRGQTAALRVVPGAIQRSGNGVFAVICMTLLAGGLVALLMMNTALAEGTFRLDALGKQAGELTDQREQLTQAIDDLAAPRTLADRAQQMGMVPAQSMAFVNLGDGSILGVAQPASPMQRLNVVTSPTPPPPAPATPATPPVTAATPAAPATAATPAPGTTPAAPAATAPAGTTPKTTQPAATATQTQR